MTMFDINMLNNKKKSLLSSHPGVWKPVKQEPSLMLWTAGLHVSAQHRSADSMEN